MHLPNAAPVLQVITDPFSLSLSLSSLSAAHRERLDPLEPVAQVDPRDLEESPVSTDQSAPLALL